MRGLPWRVADFSLTRKHVQCRSVAEKNTDQMYQDSLDTGLLATGMDQLTDRIECRVGAVLKGCMAQRGRDIGLEAVHPDGISANAAMAVTLLAARDVIVPFGGHEEGHTGIGQDLQLAFRPEFERITNRFPDDDGALPGGLLCVSDAGNSG